MKIETLAGLIAAHESAGGHVLLLDINNTNDTMEKFPNVFIQQCKLVVEIDRGAGLAFPRKMRCLRVEDVHQVDGGPAVFV